MNITVFGKYGFKGADTSASVHYPTLFFFELGRVGDVVGNSSD